MKTPHKESMLRSNYRF